MSFVPVSDLVNAIMPRTSEERISAIIVFENKWRLLLYQGLNVPTEDRLNPQSYPYEANLLIAYLICRDILSSIILDATSMAALSGEGSIKKITTGPTEIERFSLGDGIKDIMKAGGIWESFMSQICSLANLLGVYISGCRGETVSTLKVGRGSDYSYEHAKIEATQFIKKEF